ALVGAVLSAKGKPVIGAPMLIGAALFFAGQGKLLRKGRTATPKPLPPQDIAQARALLGVAPDADADMIRAAHRRLIASVHPDKGGTEALAAQINAARDLLLRHQAER
ncbi:MAG: molecular chaperone DnaJ, partial [Sphingobium sp. SCN 64-10]